MTTQLRRLDQAHVRATPELEENLQAMARENPDLEQGTSMAIGGARMQYHQARLEFIEAARAVGARVD